MTKKKRDQALDILSGRITPQEAAKTLKVTPRRILALIAAQRLPAVQIAGRWLILKADLAIVRHRKPGRPAKD